jgi:hypothetical protein
MVPILCNLDTLCFDFAQTTTSINNILATYLSINNVVASS